jgi:uncharacterized protein DUF4019
MSDPGPTQFNRCIVGQAHRLPNHISGRRSACPTIALCVFSILLIGCASHSASRAEKRANENDARAAALHWLQLLAEGDYEQAFEFEAQDFRMYRTQSQFVRFMQARRAPFGKTIDRKFIGAAHVEKFVGAPEGNYESVLFKTNFEHKNPTAERVILIDQPAGWRVIDYKIY